jgi:hypothetical protein
LIDSHSTLLSLMVAFGPTRLFLASYANSLEPVYVGFRNQCITILGKEAPLSKIAISYRE